MGNPFYPYQQFLHTGGKEPLQTYISGEVANRYKLGVRAYDLELLLGAKEAVKETNPDAAADINQLIKGLLYFASRINDAYDSVNHVLKTSADLVVGDEVIIKGDVAHDAVDTGNPQKIGGHASAVTPAAVAIGDRVNAYFNLRGMLATFVEDGYNVALGAKASGATTDPTAAADAIQLLKGLMKQLQGDGIGAAPVTVSGSLAEAETATIASGTALSGAVDLESKTVIAISMPAAWTTATISIDVSNDGTNYKPLYYQGYEYVITEAAANRNISIDPVPLLPWRYIKLRSGLSAAPVNQGAEAVIIIYTKPI